MLISKFWAPSLIREIPRNNGIWMPRTQGKRKAQNFGAPQRSRHPALVKTLTSPRITCPSQPSFLVQWRRHRAWRSWTQIAKITCPRQMDDTADHDGLWVERDRENREIQKLLIEGKAAREVLAATRACGVILHWVPWHACQLRWVRMQLRTYTQQEFATCSGTSAWCK